MPQHWTDLMLTVLKYRVCAMTYTIMRLVLTLLYMVKG